MGAVGWFLAGLGAEQGSSSDPLWCVVVSGASVLLNAKVVLKANQCPCWVLARAGCSCAGSLHALWRARLEAQDAQKFINQKIYSEGKNEKNHKIQ